MATRCTAGPRPAASSHPQAEPGLQRQHLRPAGNLVTCEHSVAASRAPTPMAASRRWSATSGQAPRAARTTWSARPTATCTSPIRRTAYRQPDGTFAPAKSRSTASSGSRRRTAASPSWWRLRAAERPGHQQRRQPAVHRRHRPPPRPRLRSGCADGPQQRPGVRGRHVRRHAGRPDGMKLDARGTCTSRRTPPRASGSTRPTGRCSGSSGCRGAGELPGAAPKTARCSSPRTRRSTAADEGGRSADADRRIGRRSRAVRPLPSWWGARVGSRGRLQPGPGAPLAGQGAEHVSRGRLGRAARLGAQPRRHHQDRSGTARASPQPAASNRRRRREAS